MILFIYRLGCAAGALLKSYGHCKRCHNVLLLLQRAPELSCISVQERVEPLLQFLQSLQLAPEDLRVMLLRCPRLLSFSTQRQVMPVVQFLREDLGFDEQQVASTLRRFPGIMG